VGGRLERFGGIVAAKQGLVWGWLRRFGVDAPDYRVALRGRCPRLQVADQWRARTGDRWAEIEGWRGKC
jgi:hypothetical protein